jgi:hypothetical protein
MIPRWAEGILDRACRMAGMVGVEEHGFLASEWGEPAHMFWRASLDGMRFLAIGGDIYAFQLQLGRLTLIVETWDELEFIRKAYQEREGVSYMGKHDSGVIKQGGTSKGGKHGDNSSADTKTPKEKGK